MKEEIINTKDYISDLKKIKASISENRNKAMFVVNSAMIITYYQIGTIINSRKKWGANYVKRLSDDLKEFGKGYSFEHLMKMTKFATTFSKNEILEQPVTKIPWGTILCIIEKSSSKEEMAWYIEQTYINKWSRSTTIKQFEAKAYQRHLINPISTTTDDEKAFNQEVFKDTLALDFLTQLDLKSEKSLKTKLLENITAFLQELGAGFALLGHEYKLVTPTGKNFYVDLLMYHTKIHAYVVIELKIGELQPSDIGQLNFYVNAIDDLERTQVDNKTIGILLCKEADSYVAKTSMSGINASIGISKYKLLEDLPNYLVKKLNELN